MGLILISDRTGPGWVNPVSVILCLAMLFACMTALLFAYVPTSAPGYPTPSPKSNTARSQPTTTTTTTTQRPSRPGWVIPVSVVLSLMLLVGCCCGYWCCYSWKRSRSTDGTEEGKSLSKSREPKETSLTAEDVSRIERTQRDTTTDVSRTDRAQRETTGDVSKIDRTQSVVEKTQAEPMDVSIIEKTQRETGKASPIGKIQNDPSERSAVDRTQVEFLPKRGRSEQKVSSWLKKYSGTSWSKRGDGFSGRSVQDDVKPRPSHSDGAGTLVPIKSSDSVADEGKASKSGSTGNLSLVTNPSVSSAGVGKSTTYRLALSGATVYMFCRNVEKAKRVRKEIVRKSFNNDIHIVKCDLCDFETVKEAAKQFLSSDAKIDGLINNAGVMYLSGSKQTTKDGHEEQMQGNHLGHFLLTNLLLGRVKESKGRVVNVSSIAALLHRNMGSTRRFDVSDLSFNDRKYKGGDSYGCSKLANILFTRELSRRVMGTGVTVNCCHPGAVNSDLLKFFPQVLVNYMVPIVVSLGFMKSNEQGAMTSLYLATSDDVAHVSGEYFADCAPGCASVQALNDQTAADLWDASQKIVAAYM